MMTDRRNFFLALAAGGAAAREALGAVAPVADVPAILNAAVYVNEVEISKLEVSAKSAYALRVPVMLSASALELLKQSWQDAFGGIDADVPILIILEPGMEIARLR